MNLRSISLWAGCALLANSAAFGASNAAAPSAATTTATNAPISIPKSIFVLPANSDEGKDPFFPRSMRPYGSIVIKTNPQVAIVVPVQAPTVELHLDGISGTPDHRLAIINYHTFEVGEEADVPSGAIRAHVRCLEIRADSVIVQVAGERRILRLRSGL